MSPQNWSAPSFEPDLWPFAAGHPPLSLSQSWSCRMTLYLSKNVMVLRWPLKLLRIIEKRQLACVHIVAVVNRPPLILCVNQKTLLPLWHFHHSITRSVCSTKAAIHPAIFIITTRLFIIRNLHVDNAPFSQLDNQSVVVWRSSLQRLGMKGIQRWLWFMIVTWLNCRSRILLLM